MERWYFMEQELSEDMVPRIINCHFCDRAYSDSDFYVYNTKVKKGWHVECSPFLDPKLIANGTLVITCYNKRKNV